MSKFEEKKESKAKSGYTIRKDCIINDSEGKYYQLKEGDKLPEEFGKKENKGFFDSFKSSGIL